MQKATFCTIKDHVLQCETRPFGKALAIRQLQSDGKTVRRRRRKGQEAAVQKTADKFWNARDFHYFCNQIITCKAMTQEEKTAIEERIVDVLKTVYDPEIPVNIYDLGLIYKIDVKDDATVDIDMTFTAPTCPAADFILEDVRQKVDALEGVKAATVNLVFEPAWDQSMLSEEARLELGLD